VIALIAILLLILVLGHHGSRMILGVILAVCFEIALWVVVAVALFAFVSWALSI